MGINIKVKNLGNRIVNCYLFHCSDGYLLIDTGYEKSFTTFQKKLKAENISLSEVNYIFLTHAHDDHAGFLNELLKKTEAKVILHPKAVEWLIRGQNSFEGGCSSTLAYLFCKIMCLLGKGEHYFPNISSEFYSRLITIDSSNYLEIARNLPFRVIETPGHTSCSISLLLHNGILFCGDAAMNGFPSRKRITIWIENKEDFQGSWKKIMKEKPIAIYPAHGKPFPVSDLEKYLLSVQNIKLIPLKMPKGKEKASNK